MSELTKQKMAGMLYMAILELASYRKETPEAVIEDLMEKSEVLREDVTEDESRAD